MRDFMLPPRETDENCFLMGYYAASSGNSLHIFSEQPIDPIFKGQEPKKKVFLFRFFYFSNSWAWKTGTDRLSRNVGKELSLLAAQ